MQNPLHLSLKKDKLLDWLHKMMVGCPDEALWQNVFITKRKTNFSPTRALFGENVCQDERIGSSLAGGTDIFVCRTATVRVKNAI